MVFSRQTKQKKHHTEFVCCVLVLNVYACKKTIQASLEKHDVIKH